MSTTTRNGHPPTRATPSDERQPMTTENPFLAPAWTSTPGIDLTRPSADLKGILTKEQLRVYQAGQTQLLKQHFQHLKAGYATAASGQIEDLANHVYVHVASAMAERTIHGRHPEAIQPYLDLYMDASLQRFAPELLQIASDHHRSQHDLAAEVIQIVSGRGFWDALKMARRSS